MQTPIRYVIITPVRDEVSYIKHTLLSVIEQTIIPVQWIIVDDGSTDGTGEILNQYSKKYDWITVVHRPNRGSRKSGGGVIEAFYDGYAFIKYSNWDFLVKLDGDLSFPSDYFQKCFEHFVQQPKLGIGGGTVCGIINGEWKEESTGDPPFHVRGATKVYRRSCWEKISPLIMAPGWDTIDEVKANFYGWTTNTFRNLALRQHKATGSADGHWQNWFKNGLANYNTGYHPIFMIAKCLKRALQKPSSLMSVALWSGYCSGYFRRISQVQESEVIFYLRHQQICHLLLRPSIYGKEKVSLRT
jgi:poly-beta-1,6-N-acetyl-D-glucosamine synthase